MFRIANGGIECVEQYRSANYQNSREQEGEQQIQSDVGEHGPQSGAGEICNSNVVVLKACVDAGLLDLANELFIELLVGLCLTFDLLVLKRAAVDFVVFRLCFYYCFS